MIGKRLALVGASVAAVAGTTLAAAPGASASTEFVGNTTCPSYVTGGGGCQYVQIDRTVPGATGTLRVIVFYHWSSGGGSYEIYDCRIQNNSSRAHSLTDIVVQDPNGNVPEEQPLSQRPQSIPTGGYVWDQHNAVGSYFWGKFLPAGVGPRAKFELHNSASGGNFFASSDVLP